jgi:redox-sensitive bicupin YhaK (pirin superfamily)
MSKRSDDVSAEECVALGASRPRLEAYPNRELSLGSLTISRALPIRDRRMIGPWCFLDRFGPLAFSEGKPMDVAPHPHMGLQTVTWLLDGEVVHDDSLGYESVLRPNGGRLNGVQLWVALLNAQRHMPPGFMQVKDVPRIESPDALVRVFAGTLQGTMSPAPHYSDLLGADVDLGSRRTCALPLNPAYEHAVLVLNGDCTLEGERLKERVLYYLGTNRSEASFVSQDGGRVLLIGGPPFPEPILMWWNFVARTAEEIAQARDDWETEQRFGEVTAYSGPRLPAPSLARFARPNPVS